VGKLIGIPTGRLAGVAFVSDKKKREFNKIEEESVTQTGSF